MAADLRHHIVPGWPRVEARRRFELYPLFPASLTPQLALLRRTILCFTNKSPISCAAEGASPFRTDAIPVALPSYLTTTTHSMCEMTHVHPGPVRGDSPSRES